MELLKGSLEFSTQFKKDLERNLIREDRLVFRESNRVDPNKEVNLVEAPGLSGDLPERLLYFYNYYTYLIKSPKALRVFTLSDMLFDTW